MSETWAEYRERQKCIDYLEGIYGREGFYNLMEKISKLRAKGVDIEAELDKEIKKREQAA